MSDNQTQESAVSCGLSESAFQRNVSAQLNEAVELLRRAKAQMGSTPRIGAQRLSEEITRFVADYSRDPGQ